MWCSASELEACTRCTTRGRRAITCRGRHLQYLEILPTSYVDTPPHQLACPYIFLLRNDRLWRTSTRTSTGRFTMLSPPTGNISSLAAQHRPYPPRPTSTAPSTKISLRRCVCCRNKSSCALSSTATRLRNPALHIPRPSCAPSIRARRSCTCANSYTRWLRRRPAALVPRLRDALSL